MMIEQKHTADDSFEAPSEAPSDEEVECAVNCHKNESPSMAANKHKRALTAGICGVLILAAIVAVVAGLVSNSFQRSSDASTGGSDTFDFGDVGPDFSNVRAPSNPPQSTSRPNPRPSPTPTDRPSSTRTDIPTSTPTDSPSPAPSPTPTAAPTGIPSPSPIRAPTIPPVPTTAPTMAPATASPVTPIDPDSSTLLIFCVIADVPYYDNEKEKLPDQIKDQMEDCEFLVHLGDIMRGEIDCDEYHYENLRETLLQSKVPSFIVPGDNEWNDCGNNRGIEAAWGHWTTHFMNLENNWNHTIPVVRQPEYQENFYFIRKQTLVIGLNIVGGRIQDEDEWLLRHSSEIDWVRSLIAMNIRIDGSGNAAGVIIMAHARPNNTHRHFFNPLTDYIRDELQNRVPVLYLHGDGHKFMYNSNFYDQPNFLAIQHEGGVRDPIMKIMADPHHLGPEVYDAFQYDRQLHFDQ